MEWTQIGDHFYLLTDALSQGEMSYIGAKATCDGLSEANDVILFEPRSEAEQAKVLEKLSSWIASKGNAPKFWINAIKQSQGYIYRSDEEIISNTFWKTGQPNQGGQRMFVLMDSTSGKWEDVDFNGRGYTICQASTKNINPQCKNPEGMGKVLYENSDFMSLSFKNINRKIHRAEHKRANAECFRLLL